MDLNTFRQRYKELDPIERDLLKIMAVAFEPIDDRVMVLVLRRMQVFKKNGELFVSSDLAVPRQHLDDAGWLDYSAGDAWALRPAYLPLVMRMAVIDLWYKVMLQTLRSELPLRPQAGMPPRNFQVCLRELSAALYAADVERFAELSEEAQQHFPIEWLRTDLPGILFGPFDADWLATFPAEVQGTILGLFIDTAIGKLANCGPYVKWFEDTDQLPWHACPPFLQAICLRGEAGRWLKRLGPKSADMDAGWKATLQWMAGEKEVEFQPDTSYRSFFSRSSTWADFRGLVHILSELAQSDGKSPNALLELFPKRIPGSWKRSFDYLKAAIQYQANDYTEAVRLLADFPESPLDWLFYGLASYWCDVRLGSFELLQMQETANTARLKGYVWLAEQIEALFALPEFTQELEELPSPTAAEGAAAAPHTTPPQPAPKAQSPDLLVNLLVKKPMWQRALEALESWQPTTSLPSTRERLTRLAWLVDFDTRQLQPVEQVLGNHGWSKGRAVSLKRLRTGDLNAMTPQDFEIARAIEVLGDPGVSGNYSINFYKALPALVGHPFLFLLREPGVPVELVEEPLRLVVMPKGEGLELCWSHPVEDDKPLIIRETPTRYVLVQPTPLHLELMRKLGHEKLEVPPEGKEKTIEVLRRLRRVVEIHTPLEAITGEVEVVEGDPTPHVHLLPAGEGFKVEIFAKPLSTDPPWVKPGRGWPMLMVQREGQTVKVLRNLEAEEENARMVEEACPTLMEFPSENREWYFEQPELALQALLELEPLVQSGLVVVEYPKGQPLRIRREIGLENLHLSVRRNQNWFDVEGTAELDEDEVLEVRKLLALNRQKGRFVKLDDGQFVALTEQLRRKLTELDSLLDEDDGSLHLHPLAASAFEDFASDLADFHADEAWQQQLQRLRELDDYQAPPPEPFLATLRHYQEEGYQWLMRLAHWGVGACLADDMGLGKTVQALAVLTSRASLGPALVVAPASVVRNWYRETLRFAPALTPIIYGESDRSTVIDELAPGSLLLCSYGLMQQDAQRLTKVHFATIVLDEAQAIKNRATKRSKAAMQLQGDFKIITTGTPIENHLGELWNLFRFLNPGLLGSLERFTEKFALPIERDHDEVRREQLRRLIRPFMLRRKKADVLKELPPKTEITLDVELSHQERVFYEALRRQALENIHSAKGSPQHKRFQVLAELMRLRQAACHPRLVDPTSTIPSSKLNAFAELVEELLEEGHKALVFSQFVQHLKIIENWVKSRHISYQYLDGSTPMKERDRAIQAFQAGEGELFLISLKAGGFGLNLTAADYVIHMDPWWNPAVEDQASDRAHRIGQERPVTIYRLVSSGTIEEKIVKLHAEKRELADSLLEGTEAAARLNVEELVALLEG